jgi:hypothetical protein
MEDGSAVARIDFCHMHARGGKGVFGSSPTATERRRDLAECALPELDPRAWVTGRARGETLEIPVQNPALGWPVSIVTAECGLYTALRLLQAIRQAASRRDQSRSC